MTWSWPPKHYLRVDPVDYVIYSDAWYENNEGFQMILKEEIRDAKPSQWRYKLKSFSVWSKKVTHIHRELRITIFKFTSQSRTFVVKKKESYEWSISVARILDLLEYMFLYGHFNLFDKYPEIIGSFMSYFGKKSSRDRRYQK